MKKNGKSFDVDIELDNSINIQVWYVTGLLNNFIINQEDSKTQTKYRDKLKLSEHSSIVSEYGGTHHSWENQQILKWSENKLINYQSDRIRDSVAN